MKTAILKRERLMARRRKERSLGEMISTICFYLVGVYFVFEGVELRDGGAEPLGIRASGLRASPAYLVELVFDR